MALSIGIRNSISLFSAIRATRPLTLTLVGLSPTEHTSFFLDTLPYGGFSPVRLQGWPVRRCLPKRGAQLSRPSGLLPSFALIASNLYVPALCRGGCALERRHSSDFNRS